MGSSSQGFPIGQRANAETANGKNSPVVDWDFLPEDLLARILSRLPFSSLIRSRCVCKKWNALNFTSDFTFSGNLASKCVPVYFFEGPLRVYNSGTNAWEEHSLEFLKLAMDSLALLASAGRLLCFKNRVSGELVVCNPITKRWKAIRLPDGFDHGEIKPPTGDIWARTPNKRQRWRDRDSSSTSPVPGPCSSYQQHARDAYLQAFGRKVIVALLPHKNDKSFKLLVAGVSDGHGKERTTLTYDSLEERWSKGGQVPRGVRFWESGKTLYCDGYLYCITWSHGLPSEACDLESPYNVMEDSWTEYPLNSSPGIILPQLVEHRGRGFVVQRRFRNGGQVEISFAEVKKDDPMSLMMFKHWPVDLFPLDPDEAELVMMVDWCLGQGDWFYLALGYRHYSKSQGLPVLAYDLTMDTWKKLPTLRDDFLPSPLWLRTFEASITASV